MGLSLDMDSIDQNQQKRLPSAVYQSVDQKQLLLPFNLTQSFLAKGGCPSVYTLPEAVGKDYGRQEEPDLTGRA